MRPAVPVGRGAIDELPIDDCADVWSERWPEPPAFASEPEALRNRAPKMPSRNAPPTNRPGSRRANRSASSSSSPTFRSRTDDVNRSIWDAACSA